MTDKIHDLRSLLGRIMEDEFDRGYHMRVTALGEAIVDIDAERIIEAQRMTGLERITIAKKLVERHVIDPRAIVDFMGRSYPNASAFDVECVVGLVYDMRGR